MFIVPVNFICHTWFRQQLGRCLRSELYKINHCPHPRPPDGHPCTTRALLYAFSFMMPSIFTNSPVPEGWNGLPHHHTAPSVFNCWQQSPPPSIGTILQPNCSYSDSSVHNTLYQFLLDHFSALCVRKCARIFVLFGTRVCYCSSQMSSFFGVTHFSFGLSLVLEPEHFQMLHLFVPVFYF